jgi:hypothetical protein
MISSNLQMERLVLDYLVVPVLLFGLEIHLMVTHILKLRMMER